MDLVEEIKSYFKEADKYNYPEVVINMDLNKIVDNYIEDLEETIRDDCEAQFKDRVEDALRNAHDVVDYLEDINCG